MPSHGPAGNPHGLFPNMSDKTRFALAAAGRGLSQLGAGQAVNLAPELQALQQRQQRAEFKRSIGESGILDQFTPQQQAVIASMPQELAQQVLMKAAFPPPPDPIERQTAKDVTGRLRYLDTGEPAFDIEIPESPIDRTVLVGANDTEQRAKYGLPPDGSSYEVKFSENPDGSISIKDFSIPGGRVADTLSPGALALDKAYADEYLAYLKGGGADANVQTAQIKTVLDALEAGESLTGPIVGSMPDFVNAVLNPDVAQATALVRGVVQRSLRETLGAQFAEKEGEKLIQAAYDPKLPPAYNAARLRALYAKLDNASKAKAAMAEYFGENQTLFGYKGPGVPSVDELYDAINSVGPPPAANVADIPAMPEGFAKSYGDVAKDNGITIEQLWEAWPNK